MIEIRMIEPEITYSLRHRVLRPHQKIEDCMYDTDHQAGGFHVGAFFQAELISVASFCMENHPDFSSKKQYRLRAMATLEQYRKLGAGRKVVNYGEQVLKEQGVDLLWCKGRTTVQGYYRKIGFRVHGEVFDYPPIGPHIVMYKKIS